MRSLNRCIVIAVGLLILLLLGIAFWWTAQLPFDWLKRREVIARLRSAPDWIAPTDLDGDRYPEVLLAWTSEGTSKASTLLLCDPLGKPKLIPLPETVLEILLETMPISADVPLKAVPVQLRDGRLRLLRIQNNRFVLSRLANLPDVPLEWVRIDANRNKAKIFLVAYPKGRPSEAWVSLLSRQGEWQPAVRFVNDILAPHGIFSGAGIKEAADLDRDGKLDAICVIWHPGEFAWVLWGGRNNEKELGIWTRYGQPLTDDLDGDGWSEVAMIDDESHVKVWRFGPISKRLQAIAFSPLLDAPWAGCSLGLADVDGDGLNELVLQIRGTPMECHVFKLTKSKLAMHSGTLRAQNYMTLQPINDGAHRYFVTTVKRTVFLLPPRIYRLGWLWQVKFTDKRDVSAFWRLPKGEAALSPKNWRQVAIAPFELTFAKDVDGDGVDELFGKDLRGRFGVWQLRGNRFIGVPLSVNPKRYVTAALIVQDRQSRALLLAWNDGVLERFMVVK